MKGLLKRFENLSFPIVGVGVTAFNRVMPAFFLPDYQIVCYKNSRELEEIGKKCPVVSIERDFKMGVKRLNSFAILKHPDVLKYLKKLGVLGIFVYKSTRKIEAVCQENNWRLIANPPEIRDPFENKKIFRETLEKIGIQPIEGEVLKISKFNEQVFKRLQEKYGKNLVLKLPEVRQGEGKGNTFVEKKSDLENFWKKIKRLGEIYELQNLIVERKIEGISPSITGCVTRHGVLAGVVQTQIIDIPEVVSVKKGGGMFVGHDWSFRHYPEKVQKQAERIACLFGEYLHRRGYKGIFGIDLIVEEKTNNVYPCECNPRYTGAFPVYPMIQLKQGETLFDIFHLLEHLNLDYEIDFRSIQDLYRQRKEGAHLVVSNRFDRWVRADGEIRVGAYRLKNNELEFLRPGFSLLDIKNEDEFVLTDGVPFKGALIKPNLRILKIIFPHQILAADSRQIDQRTKKIVEAVYSELDLKMIKSPHFDGGTNVWEERGREKARRG